MRQKFLIIVLFAISLSLIATVSIADRFYTMPGDVNGDGGFNIADPIYLLNTLFLDGPEPAECNRCVHQVGVRVTGQTGCYGIGTEEPCDSKVYPGQDAFYRNGHIRQYVDNDDGTITDRTTGLMWQKVPLFADWNWQEALNYCDIMNLAGHRDWRLPNIMELHTLINYNHYAPALDPVFEMPLSLAPSAGWHFWSSTTHVRFKERAWYVSFGAGEISKTNKAQYGTFLAVRGPVVCD